MARSSPRSVGALLLEQWGSGKGTRSFKSVVSRTFRLGLTGHLSYVHSFPRNSLIVSSGADPRTGSWGWAVPHPCLTFSAPFPVQGWPFSDSFLVSHWAEGRQNRAGAVAIALAEIWNHGVGTGRGGERRLKPQVKECPGKVHSPYLGIPWMFLTSWKCKQRVSFICLHRPFAVS